MITIILILIAYGIGYMRGEKIGANKILKLWDEKDNVEEVK